MAQPAYPNAHPAAVVAQRLAAATRERHHEFWPATLNALADETFSWDHVLSSRHATGVYLLALAVQRNGRFVTFDGHVPARTVRGAAAPHLVVIE